MLHTLLRLDRNKFVQPWFRALEVWSEVEEILESDTFDGHHRTIVEHTLHVLFLPCLHKEQTSQTHGDEREAAFDGIVFRLVGLRIGIIPAAEAVDSWDQPPQPNALPAPRPY